MYTIRVTKARSIWRGRDQRAAVTHLPLFIRALWERSHKRPVVNESWKLLVQTIIPHENVYQSILFVTLFASLHLNFNCWAGSRNNTETVGWQPQQNKLWRWGSWWAQTLDKNKTFKAHHGEHHVSIKWGSAYELFTSRNGDIAIICYIQFKMAPINSAFTWTVIIYEVLTLENCAAKPRCCW